MLSWKRMRKKHDQIELQNERRLAAKVADPSERAQRAAKGSSRMAAQLMQLVPDRRPKNDAVVHQVALADLNFEAKQSRERPRGPQNQSKE